jgi:hypothetical protein
LDIKICESSDAQIMNDEEAVFDANQYRGLWVAFRGDTDEVVASGPTLQAVIRQAEENGIQAPEFYKVPESDAYFVGAG